jgi:transposase-like protein
LAYVYTSALPFFDLTMAITINEDLRAYIDPLTEDEYAALERSLLSEGCRDALVLWGDLLVDGHNRYGICLKHGISFNTVQNKTFQSLDDVHLWMIDNHLGRRSVSDFQRGVLALRKKEIVSVRLAQEKAQQPSLATDEAEVTVQSAHQPVLTRQAVARSARVSSATLGQIEKIQKTAAPELVSAVKAGVISINAAAAVASLPSEKQVAAVSGGKKELRQAARQVREAKLPPKQEPVPPPSDATPDQLEICRLTQQLAKVTEERDQLKKKVQHLTIALAEARGEQ